MVIVMFAVGSHQVVAGWNSVVDFLIPRIQFVSVFAGMRKIAFLMTTAERKPERKKKATKKGLAFKGTDT